MSNPKYHSHRSFQKSHKPRNGPRKEAYQKPRVDRLLKQTLKKIGVPGEAPFIPDPFQLEALDKIQDADVLVTAPTGSGKTWIASQVIGQYLSKGLRTWYASPLKALTNSIYLEFSKEFGQDVCGIVTGERKENTSASIIVGTTEILRNQLYDAMHQGTNIEADLVILDEAHYLSDPERGVVWEEVLIYMPSRVRLLLLSATISNAEEVCAWLRQNRGTKIHVVRSVDRPVPLDMLFLFPDGLLAPLSGRKGLTAGVKKYLSSQTLNGRRRGTGVPNYGDILRVLRQFDLLPAIFFLKSRLDCDKAVFSCLPLEEESRFKDRMRKEVKSFLQEYPHLEGHRQMGPLLDARVASHHAGQLPYWKVLIEKLMNRGYLHAIFSTSTVAAGVNFPARTVVLVQSDRFNGHEFSDLTATDLHQMIGRAGRRGKDNIGFALVLPGLHQDPQLIDELKSASPEPLTSQIRINFSMTLNLLLSHTPLEVKDLLDRSFATFQQKQKGSSVEKEWHRVSQSLKRLIPNGMCDNSDPFEVLELIRKRSEWRREKRALLRKAHHELTRSHLLPGRIFSIKNDEKYLLFSTYEDKGQLMCRAHPLDRPVRMRKEKIRLRRIPLDKVEWLYEPVVSLPQEYDLESLQAIIDSVDSGQLQPLDISARDDQAHKQNIIERRLDHLPCESCEHVRDCHGKRNKDLRRVLGRFLSLADSMAPTGEGLWVSFKRHLRFLKDTHFVDEDDRLTSDGEWASKLRLDQPLLIAEAIRKGGLSNLSPEVLAGCIALFVWDRDQDVDIKVRDRQDIRELEDAFDHLIESMANIREQKAKKGFDNPPIFAWPAYALFLWAKFVPWDQLLFHISVSDGDMASLIVRTADHLRQVMNLRETHPGLASVAGRAISLILREPVYIE
ncbi:MAG: DEAD/DEAH box helicase [Deltaproteobacteria bacterium]|nr:DEAD/DEAH box helicase [Deltaproteobacteria bacterium]